MNTKHTPRTDAQTGEHSQFYGVEMVSADFARQLETQVQELREALAALVTVAPAFRAKDVGAPNSFARTAQELHIKAEDNARAILEKTS